MAFFCLQRYSIQLFVIFFFVVLCYSVDATAKAAASGAEGFSKTDSSIPAGVAKLLQDLAPESTIAFVELTENDGTASKLSQDLYLAIEQELIRIGLSKGYHFIERRDLKLILDEWSLDAFDTKTADKGARSLLGADFILSGRLTVHKKLARCNLKMTNLQNGEIVSVAQFSFDRDADVAPLGQEKDATPVSSAQDVSVSSEKTGNLRLWTDKNVYHVGDQISIYFEVLEPLYVKIFDVTPDGEVTVIFPNPYQPDNYCFPGKRYAIPPQGASFALTVTPPLGKERIKGIASTSPITDSAAVQTRGIKFTKQIIKAAKTRTTHTLEIK